jgi:hypothetical protein
MTSTIDTNVPETDSALDSAPIRANFAAAAADIEALQAQLSNTTILTTTNMSSQLPYSRRLNQGSGISFTDGGPGGTFTISSTATGTIGGSTGNTDNRVLRADGTGGSTLQNSPVSIADTTGVISGTQGITFTGTSSGTTTLVPAAVASGSLALPAATDTLVGKETTDILKNKTIDADLNTLSNIENADIKAAAGIALNKLAATTASRALVSDASGFVSAATTTSTEIGYLAGVSSNVQTQLNSKQGTISLTTTGTSGAATLIGDTLNVPIYVSGTGDVVGPASATDNAVSRFDSTTGKLIQNSSVLIDDNGNITMNGSGVDFTVAGGALEINTPSLAASISNSGILLTGYTLNFGVSDAAIEAAANRIDIRNGANAQTFRVYGTYTDASNGDWLNITKAAGGAATISTGANGTGTAGALTLTAPTLTTPILGTPVSGTLTNCTGLPIGGISASGTPSASNYLRGDGTWATIAASGDVVGPASSTDNALVRFDLTTGKLIQNSTVTLSDTGLMTIDEIQTSGSSGIALKNSSGTTVVTFGSANTTNVTFAGAVNAGGSLNLTATGLTYGINSDVFLARDTANTLALRNSTNAQTFRVYGTYTDASNGDWLNITKAAGSTVTINPQANGTGTAGALTISTASGSNTTITGGTNLILNGGSNVVFQNAGVQRAFISASQWSLSPTTASAAANPRFFFTAAADTSLTASTEAIAVQFNLSATRQHATGAITLQRDFVIQGTNHSAVGASTITDQAALAVEYGNVSTNITTTNLSAIYVATRALTTGVTNAYGLNVTAPSGATNNFAARFDGTVVGTSQIRLGVAGSAVGSVQFSNATSGTVTMQPVAGALGTVTLSLPAATDTLVGKATTDTLTNKTLTDAVNTVSTPTTTSVGYLGAPQNLSLDSADYTLVITDSGKSIDKTVTNARTLTIPANGSVAFPIGTIITGSNEGTAGSITMAITTDTLKWGASTGSRTIAINGSWTLKKVTSTSWRLTGDGIT